MSVAAMTWALSQWLDPGPKMVLVAIADRVNHKSDDDSGFPSLDDIAETACQSRRSVQRHIATLEEMGLLSKRFRHAEGGRQTSNLYRINMDVRVGKDGKNVEIGGGEGDNLTPSGGCQNDTLGGDTGDTLGGDTADTPMNGKINGKRNIPPQSPKGEVRETRASDDEQGFARFFKAWTSADPAQRFDDRGRALAVWRRLTPDERAAAANPATIAAVIAGQRRARRTSLMDAARYLRDKAFEQVPEASEAAATSEMVPLAAWSRAWWVRWVSVAFGAGGGAKVAFMVRMARSGTPFGVPLAEAQRFEAEGAGYAYVLVGSPEFDAWGKWATARGVTIPRPDRADRIFLPSILPPEDGS